MLKYAYTLKPLHDSLRGQPDRQGAEIQSAFTTACFENLLVSTSESSWRIGAPRTPKKGATKTLVHAP